MSTSTRWLVMLAGAIALVVVLAVAVTLIAGDEHTYPDGSPERAVQQYLAAVADRDATAASSYLSSEVMQGGCGQSFRDQISHRSANSFRITLDDTVQRAGAVQVRVHLTETYGSGGPFSSSESTREIVFDLKQENGAWRFSQTPWPSYCSFAPPRVPAATITVTASPTAAPAR